MYLFCVLSPCQSSCLPLVSSRSPTCTGMRLLHCRSRTILSMCPLLLLPAPMFQCHTSRLMVHRVVCPLCLADRSSRLIYRRFTRSASRTSENGKSVAAVRAFAQPRCQCHGVRRSLFPSPPQARPFRLRAHFYAQTLSRRSDILARHLSHLPACTRSFTLARTLLD